MNNIKKVLKVACIFLWETLISSIIILIVSNKFYIKTSTKFLIIFLLIAFIEVTRRLIMNTFGKPLEHTVAVNFEDKK